MRWSQLRQKKNFAEVLSSSTRAIFSMPTRPGKRSGWPRPSRRELFFRALSKWPPRSTTTPGAIAEGHNRCSGPASKNSTGSPKLSAGFGSRSSAPRRATGSTRSPRATTRAWMNSPASGTPAGDNRRGKKSPHPICGCGLFRASELGRALQAAASGLLLNYQLALHSPVAEAAKDRALERIGPRALGDKLNQAFLVLFNLPVVLLLDEAQAGLSVLGCALRVGADLEPVGPVEGADLQLHPRAFLHVNLPWRVFILLGGQLNDLGLRLIAWGVLLPGRGVHLSSRGIAQTLRLAGQIPPKKEHRQSNSGTQKSSHSPSSLIHRPGAMKPNYQFDAGRGRKAAERAGRPRCLLPTQQGRLGSEAGAQRQQDAIVARLRAAGAQHFVQNEEHGW